MGKLLRLQIFLPLVPVIRLPWMGQHLWVLNTSVRLCILLNWLLQKEVPCQVRGRHPVQPVSSKWLRLVEIGRASCRERVSSPV